MTDTRPAECRFRQQDEGRPYPQSNCRACNKSVTSLGNSCHMPPLLEWTIWNGGDRAPDDWDGGAVLLRNGTTCPGNEIICWDHSSQLNNGDIVGYIRKHIVRYDPETTDFNELRRRAQSQPVSAVTTTDAIHALLADGWTKRDDGTLVPPDPIVDFRQMLAQWADDCSLFGLRNDIKDGDHDKEIRALHDAICKRFKVSQMPPAGD